MKKNATAKALIMSVLALMLCLSMLVGTTFAWFTDSVKSGVNKIVAGNLDIELEYCKDPSAADAEWKTVEGAEDLFGDIALWEPGTTGVVYFRLSNLGTLALKYKLGMTFTDTVIGKNASGEDIKLSESLEFGIVADQEEKFSNRQEAMGAVATPKKLNEGFTDEQSMDVTDEKTYFALVVYMPTTTGNEANYRGENIPQIDLGVTLVATQDTVESDSFNNEYDKDATYPSFWDGKTIDTDWYTANPDADSFILKDASQVAGLAKLVSEKNTFKNKTLYLDCDINCNGNEWSPIGVTPSSTAFQGTFDGQNHVIENVAMTADAKDVGLFGYVYQGTIKNLEVKDVVVRNSSDVNDVASGIVAGTLYNGTLENVKVTGNSSVTCTIRAGGIIGSIKGSKSVVKACENYADVNVARNYAGGIAAAAHSSKATIIGCANFGNINSANETGGIVGYTDRAAITDCINYGNVTATGSYGAGGIVGFDARNYGLEGSTITSCVNNGTITAPRAGGILGTFATAPGKTQPTTPMYATIDSCTNNGDIVQTNGKTDRSGTIFGYQHSYAKGDADANINNLVVKIINCKNTGTLNGEKTELFTPSQFVEIS